MMISAQIGTMSNLSFRIVSVHGCARVRLGAVALRGGSVGDMTAVVRWSSDGGHKLDAV